MRSRMARSERTSSWARDSIDCTRVNCIRGTSPSAEISRARVSLHLDAPLRLGLSRQYPLLPYRAGVADEALVVGEAAMGIKPGHRVWHVNGRRRGVQAIKSEHVAVRGPSRCSPLPGVVDPWIVSRVRHEPRKPSI